jgi:hypothetical protein
MLDSTNAQRTSRDADDNAYQVMLDNSPVFPNMPKRGNSFICSSYRDTAASYGTPYVMVPVNGTKIAVAPVSDIFELFIRTPFYASSPTDMSYVYGLLFHLVGAPRIKRDFVDAAAINAAMSKFSPAQMAILTLICIDSSTSLRFKRETDELMLAKDMAREIAYTSRTQSLKSAELKAVSTITDAFLAGKVVKNKILDALYAMYSKEPTRMFYSLSATVMNQKTINLSIVDFGNALPSNKEVWFSGKAMAIPLRVFPQILVRLREKGFPIHQKVLAAFVNQMQSVRQQEQKDKK